MAGNYTIFSQSCGCNDSTVPKVGTLNGVSTLSQAIANGDLLSEQLAAITSQNVCVQGSFSVNTDYTFWGSVISMGDDASMSISFGKQLNVDFTIIKGCENMWNRIFVNPSSTLELTNSEIEDGKNAILSIGSSNLLLRNNGFINNNRSLNLIGTPNLLGVIEGNKFVAQGTLKPPMAGETAEAGIKLNQTNGLVIGINTPNFEMNEFSKTLNGIIASKSNFTVQSAIFDAPEPTSLLGYGVFGDKNNVNINNCQFKDLLYGVFLNDSNLDFQNNVIELEEMDEDFIAVGGVFLNGNNGGNSILKNNKIDVIDGAIQILNINDGSGLIIEGNIVSSQDDIDAQEPGNVFSNSVIALQNCKFLDNNPAIIYDNKVSVAENSFGISFEDVKNADCIDNNISFGFTSEEEPFAAGILSLHTDNMLFKDNVIFGFGTNGNNIRGIYTIASTDNSFCCNTVHQTHFGVAFSEPCLGTKFKNTTFGINHTGLLLTSDAIIGDQKHAGNRWVGGYNGDGARHEGFNNIINLSKFFVESFGPPITPLYPSDISPPPVVVDWFNFASGSTTTCSEVPNCGIVDDGSAPSDTIISPIITGVYNPDSPMGENLNRMAKEQLYKIAAKNSTELGESNILNDFYNSEAVSSIGKFHETSNNINDLAISPYSLVATYKNQQQKIKNLMNSLANLEEQLYLANSESETANIISQKSSVMMDLDNIAVENEDLHAQIMDFRINEINSIKVQNSSISANHIYEKNEQAVNRIYLNTVAVQNYTLTTTEISKLEEIAYQCPKIGGTAVYKARVLYRMHNTAFIFDDESCVYLSEDAPQNSIGLNNIPQDVTSEITVAPNPAKNEALFSNIPIQEITTELTIINAQGQVVVTQIIAPNTNNIRIKIEHLPTGIYFAKFNTTSQEKSTIIKKFMIQN